MLRNPQAVNGARISLGPPCQKKISNYIYETQGILGKGSFSTVHRGVNISTSIHFYIEMNQLPSKLSD